MSDTRDSSRPETPAADELASLRRLLRLMADLRDPDRGCAWDVRQTFATIVPYTIEEAYEVADAVARGDLGDLRDELGDLLLQVVFHARMAEERGAFAFDDVARAIGDKLVRRHPHVFTPDGATTVPAHAVDVLASLERDIFPAIGNMPIEAITTPMRPMIRSEPILVRSRLVV